MTTVVLEKAYPEPVTEEQIAQMRETTEACLDLNGVRRVKTYVSTDRTRFVCIFEATDAEAVRRSMDSVKMPYGTIYAATSF
jgi:hypothetical protein